jgi:hypothetical protein
MWFVALPIAVVMAAAMIARAYDTSWIANGQPVSATSLKGDLDEAEMRLTALESGNMTVGGTKTFSSDLNVFSQIALSYPPSNSLPVTLASKPTAENSYERYALGYGIAWDPMAKNYKVSDTTSGQSTISGSGVNGENIVFTMHSGPLSDPQTYAQWHAYDRMVITSDGKVGIGTTAPVWPLDISTSAPSTAAIRFTNTNNSPTADTRMLVFNDANDYGGIQLLSSTAASDPGSLRLFSPNLRGALVFQTTGNESMRIAVGGAVGIGTAAPATKLQVVGDLRVGTSGTNGCVQNFAGTALTGTCASDARLKQNVVAISGVLDKVAQLRPVTYEWRKKEFPDRHFGVGRNPGLIAQEVERVFPELVSTDDKGYKAVTYGVPLEMLALQAIKELRADNLRISTESQRVRTENQRVRGENLELRARLERLEDAVQKLAVSAREHRSKMKLRADAAQFE